MVINLCLWGFCVDLCFSMHCFMSFLVLQSSWRGRESWLLCFIVFWMYCYCGCPVALLHSAMGLVCGLWLWYFLILPTYFLLRLYTNGWKSKRKSTLKLNLKCQRILIGSNKNSWCHKVFPPLGQNFFISWFTNPPTVIFRKVGENKI